MRSTSGGFVSGIGSLDIAIPLIVRKGTKEPQALMMSAFGSPERDGLLDEVY